MPSVYKVYYIDSSGKNTEEHNLTPTADRTPSASKLDPRGASTAWTEKEAEATYLVTRPVFTAYRTNKLRALFVLRPSSEMETT